MNTLVDMYASSLTQSSVSKYVHLYASIIIKDQDVEITKVLINRWKGFESTGYILF